MKQTNFSSEISRFIRHENAACKGRYHLRRLTSSLKNRDKARVYIGIDCITSSDFYNLINHITLSIKAAMLDSAITGICDVRDFPSIRTTYDPVKNGGSFSITGISEKAVMNSLSMAIKRIPIDIKKYLFEGEE